MNVSELLVANPYLAAGLYLTSLIVTWIIARTRTEPSVQAAVTAAVTNIISIYKDELTRVRTEFDDFRKEVHQDMSSQNEYIDKLSSVMRAANLEVPQRPHFAYVR